MKIRSAICAVILGGTLAVVLGACGSAVVVPASRTPTPQPDATDEEADVSESLFPDVVSAELENNGDGTFDVSVTLSSPYDSADRYADAWRVLGPDGTELGVRILTHDHAGEQPFTRSLSGVAIPIEVTEVTIEGRDQVSGWGGKTVTVPVS